MNSASENVSKLNFFWFIPTHGDGSYLGSEQSQRPADYRYFREVAHAVDRLGYQGGCFLQVRAAMIHGLLHLPLRQKRRG